MSPDDRPDEWEWHVSPYADWAGRLADPDGGPGPEAVEAEPRLIELGGEPGSPERDRARARVLEEADALRLDPHERALLREARDHPGRAPDTEACIAHVDPAAVLGEDAALLGVAGLGRTERTRSAPPPAIPDAPPEEPAAAGSDAPIVVVIDDGVAFLNRRFGARGGRRTRLDAVWLQSPRRLTEWPWGGAVPPLVHAGAVIGRAEIDALLARGPRLDEEAVYRRLSRALHGPGCHRSLERGVSHGTHVADLAAGAEPDDDDPALDWPMLAVSLPPATLDHSAGHYLEPAIMAGLRWALWRARRLGTGPVVVNLSLGELAGPKDGSRPIERVTAAAVEAFEAATGRPAYLNWAFGNARLGRRAAKVEPGRHRDPRLVWRLQPDDRAASYVEVHDLATTEGLTLRVDAPDGRREDAPVPPPGRARRLAAGLVLYHVPAGPGERAHLVLAAPPTVGPDRAPAGRYGVLVLGDGPVACRMEVQRGDTPLGFRASGRQSYLEHPEGHAFDRETGAWLGSPGGPIGPARTHSSFLTARSGRVVSTGAARPDARAGARPAPFAAEGGVGEGETPGPAIAALSEGGVGLPGIVAGGTLSGSARRLGGSSAAAGMASRALAMALARGWSGPAPDARALAGDALGAADLPNAAADPRLGAGTVARAGRRAV